MREVELRRREASIASFTTWEARISKGCGFYSEPSGHSRRVACRGSFHFIKSNPEYYSTVDNGFRVAMGRLERESEIPEGFCCCFCLFCFVLFLFFEAGFLWN